MIKIREYFVFYKEFIYSVLKYGIIKLNNIIKLKINIRTEYIVSTQFFPLEKFQDFSFFHAINSKIEIYHIPITTLSIIISFLFSY